MTISNHQNIPSSAINAVKPPYITMAIFAIIGFVLLFGGIYLISLGGSWYYLVAGLWILATAVLLKKRAALALWLFAALLVVTAVWSLWEVGSDFWALAPRLDILTFMGIWLWLPRITRYAKSHQPINQTTPSSTSQATLFDHTWLTPVRHGLGLVILSIFALMGYAAFHDPQEINGTITRAQPTPKPLAGIAPGDWTDYGRTPEGTRYSPLTQINNSNVKNLKEAWTFRTGDFKTANDSGETTNQVTPLKVNNTLYFCTAHQFLIALDPATGKQKWRFDPKLKSDKTFQHLTCRGVSYHDDANVSKNAASLQARQTKSALCPRKIILPVNDGRLVAVNADTGQRCSDFGTNGEVNLQQDMPYPYPGGYNPTSPPVVTGTTIVIGGSVTDNLSTKEPSGVIRGYDVNTGKLMWVFDTGAEDPNAIPAPGQKFVHNSPNAWAPLAYDSQADVVYVPVGVGTPDIWGGNRDRLQERFANSVVALNGTTGKVLWSFQTTHHDLWDMDVPSQPTIAELTDQTGKTTPVVYVTTKTGNVFVLDRRTGKPVVPVTERAVPQTVKRGNQTKGEKYSATQPFSELNLAPPNPLQDKDMWGATMFDQLYCRAYFKSLNYEGIYTPPSENGTLVFPGNLGVFEWGGISVNPDRQVAVMNPLALPFVSTLIPQDPNRPQKEKGAGTEQGIQPMYGAPYGVEIKPFLSPVGLPCKQPGWGYVAGVDLTTHQIVWKKRIGTIRDSLPKLMQLPPLKIGVPGLGGSISTAGNVMFVAATQDNYIRAFNVSNGDKLWEARLPAGGQATPMTYEINGKQYVVIMAGGHGSFGTKMGDYMVAYALPD